MDKFKKILLVYPEIPSNTYWSFKHALRFVKKKSAMPPLGLITVAALFPESYQLKLIDMTVEKLKKKDVIWADAVFISAMVVQKESFAKVVSICNRLTTPVIAGGPHATVLYREIPGVDHFLLGEVENIFAEFLHDWQNGMAKHVYPIAERPDITNTVLPRFDLLKMKAYASMSIQYSRGCPFNCEFCDIWKVYGRKVRVKDHNRIIAELDKLYQLGWRDQVFFVDDNFISHNIKVKEKLLPALLDWQKKHNYVYRFFTQASLNMAEDDILLSRMRDTGFNSVFLGIETPCEESLQETGKLHNLKSSMLQAIRKIQSYGMEVMGGFIIGFDNDTDNIFERQIDFIQKAGIPKAMIGLLNAIPGTDLYQRLKKEQRISDYTPTGSNTHQLETNFITKMNPDKLKIGYLKLLNKLYDSNLKNYFTRCNTLLDNVAKTPLFQRKIHFEDIRTLFKSLSSQTFTRYGYQYLKFLIRNYIKNKKIFAEAVCMGIEGHHFHKITRQTIKSNAIHYTV